MKVRVARSAVVYFALLTLSLQGFFLIQGWSIGNLNVPIAGGLSFFIGSFLTWFAYWNWKRFAYKLHEVTARVWKEMQSI